MRIDSGLEEMVRECWDDKETLVINCARRLDYQSWHHDPMYGTTRNREDHQANVARLGLAGGLSQTPEDFLAAIAKIVP